MVVIPAPYDMEKEAILVKLAPPELAQGGLYVTEEVLDSQLEEK